MMGFTEVDRSVGMWLEVDPWLWRSANRGWLRYGETHREGGKSGSRKPIIDERLSDWGREGGADVSESSKAAREGLCKPIWGCFCGWDLVKRFSMREGVGVTSQKSGVVYDLLHVVHTVSFWQLKFIIIKQHLPLSQCVTSIVMTYTFRRPWWHRHQSHLC
jgi:hypothetical protein